MAYDPEYCTCGIHVHTATRILAIICLCFDTLYLLLGLGSLNETTPAKDFVWIAVYVAEISFNAMLLYGNIKRRHGFYIPGMISDLISLIVLVFLAFSCLILFILHHTTSLFIQQYRHHVPYATERALPLMIVMLLLLAGIYGYLLSICYRDYKLIKEERVYEAPEAKDIQSAYIE